MRWPWSEKKPEPDFLDEAAERLRRQEFSGVSVEVYRIGRLAGRAVMLTDGKTGKWLAELREWGDHSIARVRLELYEE